LDPSSPAAEARTTIGARLRYTAPDVNAEELAEAVDELDIRLERLRVLMEQYFQGIEKVPPHVVHKDVDRRIWILRREKIRNTGTRFRFQQIIQRYNTFSSYWQRIMREIENGTYKRDVLRAKKRFGIDATKPSAMPALENAPPSVELEPDEELTDDLSDFGDLGPLPTGPIAKVAAKPPAPPPHRPPGPPPPAHKPPPPPPPAAKLAAPPTPAPPAKPSLPVRPLPQRAPPSPAVPKILATKVESDDDLDNMLDAALGPAAQPKRPQAAKPPVVAAPVAQSRAPALKPQPTGGDDYRRVYAQYVETRRKNGESTAGLTYESLAKSLEQTKDKLRDKTVGKKVDFEVAVKDGKTVLKPVVR